jgi:hypothetical protein
MKTTSRKIRLLPVMAISFLLAVCPAYLQYNDVTEIDCLSPHPSIENLDQENLLTDEQSKTKIFVLNSSPGIFLLGISFREQIPHLSSQAFSPDQPTSILRC